MKEEGQLNIINAVKDYSVGLVLSYLVNSHGEPTSSLYIESALEASESSVLTSKLASEASGLHFTWPMEML